MRAQGRPAEAGRRNLSRRPCAPPSPAACRACGRGRTLGRLALAGRNGRAVTNDGETWGYAVPVPSWSGFSQPPGSCLAGRAPRSAGEAGTDQGDGEPLEAIAVEAVNTVTVLEGGSRRYPRTVVGLVDFGVSLSFADSSVVSSWDMQGTSVTSTTHTEHGTPRGGSQRPGLECGPAAPTWRRPPWDPLPGGDRRRLRRRRPTDAGKYAEGVPHHAAVSRLHWWRLPSRSGGLQTHFRSSRRSGPANTRCCAARKGPATDRLARSTLSRSSPPSASWRRWAGLR